MLTAPKERMKFAVSNKILKIIYINNILIILNKIQY